jgi:hypothetical protein
MGSAQMGSAQMGSAQMGSALCRAHPVGAFRTGDWLPGVLEVLSPSGFHRVGKFERAGFAKAGPQQLWRAR